MDEKSEIVFMGSSEFALIVLQKLFSDDNIKIKYVFTKPDSRSGRGRNIIFSPLKNFCLDNNIPILQPSSFKDNQIVDLLEEVKPDFLVVASYGLLIPQRILDIAKYAPLNVHGSLLPYYRGAAPIQRSIIDGWQPDSVTGVSIMKIVRELDAGPVYARKSCPIGKNTYSELVRILAASGADLLIDVMRKIKNKLIEPVEQDSSKANYASKMVKSDGIVNWNRTALEVDALVRGVTDWPGAQAKIKIDTNNKVYDVILYPGNIIKNEIQPKQTGLLYCLGNRLLISVQDGWYEPGSIKIQGKNKVAVKDFINGYLKNASGYCGEIIYK